MLRKRMLSWVFVLGFLLLGGQALAVEFEMVPLDAGQYPSYLDLNDAGQVTGYSYFASVYRTHATLLQPDGSIMDLGGLDNGNWQSEGHVINSLGHVAGRSYGQESRPFLWTPEMGMIDLGLLGGNYGSAEGINDVGQVVGYANASNFRSHPFVWSASTGMVDILDPNSMLMGYAYDINNHGQVVGSYVSLYVTCCSLPYLWSPDTGFTFLGSYYTAANAINNNGEIAGSYYAGRHYAQIWHADLTTERLGDLGGPHSFARDLNDHTEVVGESRDGANEMRAFYWSADTGMVQLPEPPGSTYATALAINNNGEILGFTMDANYRRSYLLWRPLNVPGYTPTGTDVEVAPTDADTGASPVTLTFSQVTEAGQTSLTLQHSGSKPPFGFALGSPPMYYEISTTAAFSGSVQVCIDISGLSFRKRYGVALYHLDGGTWVDVTTTVDTSANLVCGEVTSFSPFVVVEPDTPEHLLARLQDELASLNLPKGIAQALQAKLEAAAAALADGRPNGTGVASNVLAAFVNQLHAQRGKKVSTADADLLEAHAGIVSAALE